VEHDPPLSHQIQADFNLDNASIGLLIALPTLGALMRVPMGILTDRFGGRKVFTGLLPFTLLPVAFLGLAHSFWSYVIGALFLGTAGASFAVGVPFVSRWFSADRQGTALGIYGVGNVGTAATALSMSPLVQLFGSRQGAFWFYSIPVAIMALLFWLFARDAPGMVQPQPLSASFATLGRESIAWHLSLFYFVTFGGFVFFANYLPQLLGDWFPLDREDAGLQAAIFTMAATFARPVGGRLADRLAGGSREHRDRHRLAARSCRRVRIRQRRGFQAGRAIFPEEHRVDQRYRRLRGRSRWVLPTAGDGLRARSYWELRVGFRDPLDAGSVLSRAAARAQPSGISGRPLSGEHLA